MTIEQVTAIVGAFAAVASVLIGIWQLRGVGKKRNVATPGSSPAEAFWTTHAREGEIKHSGCPVLLLYIHGVGGDPVDTWGDLPRWIEAKLDVPVASAAFRYEVHLLRGCSIGSIGAELGTFLDTTAARYTDIVFVTHSLGGLVVRSALAREMKQLTAKRASLAEVGSARARRIIHLGVPIYGGVPYLSIPAAFVYLLFSPFIVPLHLVSVFIGSGRIGLNLVPFQLMFWNPWLAWHNWRWRRARRRAESQGRPFVEEYFLTGTDDPFIRSLSGGMRFKGTHPEFKLPHSPDDAIVEYIATLVCEVASKDALITTEVCRQTMVRIAEFDHNAGVTILLGALRLQFARLTRGARHRQTQWRAFGQLRAFIRRRPGVILVSGQAGAGKSTVLRRVAYASAAERLRDGSLWVPLYLNLAQINIGDVKEPSDLAHSFIEAWVEVARELIAERWTQQMHGTCIEDVLPTVQWALERCDENCVIILDGIDEFLGNHRLLGVPQIHEAAKLLCRQYDHPRVVLGLRDSPGLTYLAEKSDETLQIEYPDLTLARAHFPKAKILLENVPTQTVRVLLSPLFLARLPQWAQRLESKHGRYSVSDVFRATVVTMLDEKGLLDRKPSGVVVHQDNWIAALSILAARVITDREGDVPLTKIDERVRALKDELPEWRADPDTRQRLSQGIELLLDREQRNALIRSTVFYENRPERVRFVHLEWQSYFVGLYLADAIRARRPQELGRRGANQDIFIITAENATDVPVDAEMMSVVYGPVMGHRDADSAEVGAPLQDKAVPSYTIEQQIRTIANFSALLSNMRSYILDDALRYLERLIPKLDDPLVRHLLTAGMGYRVLRDLPDDVGRDSLKAHLRPVLELGTRLDGPLLQSACLCSIRAIYGQPVSGALPIRMCERNELIDEALGVTHAHARQWQHDPITRAVQRGLVGLVSTTSWDLPLSIVNAHYLLALILTGKKGRLFDEVKSELDAIMVQKQVIDLMETFAHERCPELSDVIKCVREEQGG